MVPPDSGGFGLDREGVGLDADFGVSAADVEADVLPAALARVEVNVRDVSRLEAGFDDSDGVVAVGQGLVRCRSPGRWWW